MTYKPKHKKCSICLKEFQGKRNFWKYCSKECQNKGHVLEQKRFTELNPHYNADWRRKKREAIITLLGGKCVCCGEKEYEFLSIDHKNGNGAEHRKSFNYNTSNVTYDIFKKLNSDFETFKNEYQVLCYNCNISKGNKINWICPHKRRLE
jgi:hypothetical protein